MTNCLDRLTATPRPSKSHALKPKPMALSIELPKLTISVLNQFLLPHKPMKKANFQGQPKQHVAGMFKAGTSSLGSWC